MIQLFVMVAAIQIKRHVCGKNSVLQLHAFRMSALTDINQARNVRTQKELQKIMIKCHSFQIARN